MTPPVHQSTRAPFGRDFSAGAQHTLASLRRRFPGAFGHVKPLALGIFDDIMVRAQRDHLELVHFMSFYTASEAYLQAQAAPGAMRYDLDGNAVAPVSEENRAYAAAALEELRRSRAAQARYRAFKAALLEPVPIEERDAP